MTVVPSSTARQIFITYADWNAQLAAVTAAGYLTGIVESDGTCRLTLTRGSTVVTASVTGTPNVTSTACGGLSVAGSKLSAGTWRGEVTYRSRTSSGSSKPFEVTVP